MKALFVLEYEVADDSDMDGVREALVSAVALVDGMMRPSGAHVVLDGPAYKILSLIKSARETEPHYAAL